MLVKFYSTGWNWFLCWHDLPFYFYYKRNFTWNTLDVLWEMIKCSKTCLLTSRSVFGWGMQIIGMGSLSRQSNNNNWAGGFHYGPYDSGHTMFSSTNWFAKRSSVQNLYCHFHVFIIEFLSCLNEVRMCFAIEHNIYN